MNTITLGRRVTVTWKMYRPGIPNAISIFRFGSILYLPKLIQGDYRLTFLVVAICAAASDWVDGELARRWKCQSMLGAAFDLIGDKGLCITLMVLGLQVWDYTLWYIGPCVVLVIYHLGVMSMRAGGLFYSLMGFERFKFFERFRFASTRVAKIKMFIEATGLIMCFSGFSLGAMFNWASSIGLSLVWIAAAFAVWSALVYFGKVRDWPKRFYPRQSP